MPGIEITLGDRTETLRPTAKAARLVNSLGGFGEAMRRLASFDLDAAILITAAGLDRKPKDIEDAVFDAGLMNLVGPLSEFIGLLVNGGRSVDDAA
jgi:hypothetical protein